MRAVTVGLLLLGLACRSQERADAFQPLAIGKPAPAYAVRTLAGDSARIQAGQPLTLVNLWATWCIPCRAEFADLQKLHNDYGARGLRVLAVSVDQGGDGDVRAFVKQRNVTFPVGRDASGDIQRLYFSIGLPESFLIGPDGTLLWRTIGALPAGAAELRAQVDSALGGERRGT